MMDNQNTFKTPKKILAQMQISHLGKILFNLQFVALAICLASILSFVVTAVYYVLLLFVSLVTVFSIYAWYPEFSAWWGGGTKLGEISLALSESWKYIVPIALVLSIGSIVCLMFDKKNRSWPKIIISIIVAVCAIVILVLKFINMKGGQA